jgi:hypothetical protein
MFIFSGTTETLQHYIMLHAKKCLTYAFQAAVIDCPYVAKRRNLSASQAHDAEMDCSTWLTVKIAFAAVNHDRVPQYGPEEINISAVLDRQSQADTKIERLSQQVEHITQSGAANAIAISASIKLVEELSAKESECFIIGLHNKPRGLTHRILSLFN